jgi:ubiquinone/menaquinone biosynthesis C-methylase UbiE
VAGVILRKRDELAAWPSGLGKGLQSPAQRFDSARRLDCDDSLEMSSTFTNDRPARAAIFDFLSGLLERRGLLEWRRILVGDLSGDVVEIGCGTGLNFPHYPADVRVVGSDLDPVMLARAVDRARDARAEVSVVVGDAMSLPVADAAADTVVIGAVLCCVTDPAAALAEVRRVLKPDGRMRFLEHVRADEGTMRARFQDAVNPLWKRVSGGCNANRDTVAAIRAADFELSYLFPFDLGLPHTRPHVVGEARARA